MTLVDEMYLISISYKVGIILLIPIVQIKHVQLRDNKNACLYNKDCAQ